MSLTIHTTLRLTGDNSKRIKAMKFFDTLPVVRNKYPEFVPHSISKLLFIVDAWTDKLNFEVSLELHQNKAIEFLKVVCGYFGVGFVSVTDESELLQEQPYTLNSFEPSQIEKFYRLTDEDDKAIELRPEVTLFNGNSYPDKFALFTELLATRSLQTVA